MLIYYSDDYYLHDPKYEYYDGQRHAYAEVPDRITQIVNACHALNLNVEKLTGKVNYDDLKQIHNSRYIDYIKHKCSDIRNEEQIMPSNFIRDTYTPLIRHTYESALKSAYVAQKSATELLQKKDGIVYALCRPPGHHAEINAMSGYCYFNNAAIAAKQLSKSGKVAILDIDYHHGNGTQAIFYGQSDILYASLHASPDGAFPYFSGSKDETGEGEGLGFNHNFPISPEADTDKYIATLAKAIKVINDYKPDYVVLSLGFDTYELDPIGGLGLSEEVYSDIGRMLNEKLTYPMLIIQEGGYNIAKLKTLATNFLSGILALTK